ncbi:DinB family protein [Fredinandcohnia quinoae]|uniref:DinB family protein n=1 Tax=Fredinandcohnia quinoae TaxID=2918902 RepID=A0AAW5E6S8_9BACI|nr:DinB family protein [Fredinandcohnia sp. SECRCQ15]MCH1624489.1 DinB family protein [Fredinandcohnia sp. SECRCQ15]
MSEIVKKQFEIARAGIFKDVEGVSPEIFDIQPDGLSNTIHWQLGHILASAEGFLFGKNGKLPSNYKDFFGYGSKPSEWGNDVPSVETLLEQLKEQLERIKNIPAESFQTQFPEPVLGNRTYGELVHFTAIHEATHAGQIHVMKRLVEASK